MARAPIDELLLQNSDYVLLNEVLDDLEAVRERVIAHIEQIHALKEDVRADPEQFVQWLRAGKLRVPSPVELPETPTIDFEKYNLTAGERKVLKRSISGLETSKTSGDTRLSAPLSQSAVIPIPRLVDIESTLERAHSWDGHEGKGNGVLPPSPLQEPWSMQDTARLEQLLEVFGENEEGRWEKIAHALKSKTRSQVEAKATTYIARLKRLGLPTPGSGQSTLLGKRLRDSSDAEASPRKRVKLEPTHTTPNGLKPGTPAPKAIAIGAVEASEYYYSPPTSLMPSGDAASEHVVHMGFKCDGCECEPIVGRRWKCQDCPEIDLCGQCHSKKWESRTHSPSHKMSEVS